MPSDENANATAMNEKRHHGVQATTATTIDLYAVHDVRKTNEKNAHSSIKKYI